MQGKTYKKRLLFVGCDVTDPLILGLVILMLYTEFIRVRS